MTLDDYVRKVSQATHDILQDGKIPPIAVAQILDDISFNMRLTQWQLNQVEAAKAAQQQNRIIRPPGINGE